MHQDGQPVTAKNGSEAEGGGLVGRPGPGFGPGNPGCAKWPTTLRRRSPRRTPGAGRRHGGCAGPPP